MPEPAMAPGGGEAGAWVPLTCGGGAEGKRGRRRNPRAEAAGLNRRGRERHDSHGGHVPWFLKFYCERERLAEEEEKERKGRLAGGVARVQRWKFTGEALRWAVGLLGVAGPSVMRLGQV